MREVSQGRIKFYMDKLIYIYSADSLVFRKNVSLKKLLVQLPSKMHERAFRYKFEQDAYNYILGRLLLKKGLEKCGMADQFSALSFQQNGKPELEGVYFNISHSANMVVCVVNQMSPIGIDIEKHKEVPLIDFRNSFTMKEWDDINQADEPLKRFYWYWTRKESVIKALGVNLSFLHQIELDPTQDFFMYENQKWWLQDFPIEPNFYGAICSQEKNFSIQTSALDLF